MFPFYVLSFSKKGDTIQGGTLFKGGHYLRKYSIQRPMLWTERYSDYTALCGLALTMLQVTTVIYGISSYKTRGYYYFSYPLNAGFKRKHYIFTT